MPMRLSILPERCIACGLCERICPDLFAVREHTVAVPLADNVDGGDLARAYEAAEECPTEAIVLGSESCHGGE